MSIFARSKTVDNKLNEIYQNVCQSIRNLLADHTNRLDPVECELFVLAISLAIHRHLTGKSDRESIRSFVNDKVYELIVHVRRDIPPDQRPRYFRGSIVHFPDMTNWLTALTWRKSKALFEHIHPSGISESIRPLIEDAQQRIIPDESLGNSKELLGAIMDCLSSILCRCTDNRVVSPIHDTF